MKKILLLFGFFVVATTGIYAQVGIGTTDPATSAQLEVYAKNKGVLIPRVVLKATDDFTPIDGAQVTSLLVYNTKTDTSKGGYEVYPGYYYWYANRWNRVISKNDFSSKEIVKEILKGSDIVTYDVKSNTFVYYNSSGTTTTETVDIIKLINSDTSTVNKINVEKIAPGTKSGTVLTTVVYSGGVTKTEWVDPVKVTVPKNALSVGDGLKVNGRMELEGAVLTAVSITVDKIDITKLTVSGTTNNGKILIVENNSITTTSTISADKIVKSNLTSSDESIKVTGGTGAVLKTVELSVGAVPANKIELPDTANTGDILVADMRSGNKSITYTNVTNLGNSLGKGDIKVSDGLSVIGTGKLLVGNVTISVVSITLDKIIASPTTDYENKLLTINNEGKFKTVTLPTGTTTSVVTINDQGVISTTTIDDLTKVTASNGLTKVGNAIQLGGTLSRITTITTTDKSTLAIKGLKATTITKTTQVVVMDKTGNVLKTVSATDFKGSGDYVTDGAPQETGNKIKTSEKDTEPKSEKMITVIVKVTTTTTSIRSSTIESTYLDKFDKLKEAATGDKKVISEIRIFSNGKIGTTGGVERYVAFSAATLEGTDKNSLVVRPGISSGGLVGPVFPGEYYIVVKYF